MPALSHRDQIVKLAFSQSPTLLTASADLAPFACGHDRAWPVLRHGDWSSPRRSAQTATPSRRAWDQTARLWDAATGAAAPRLHFPGRVNALAFSRDGQSVGVAAPRSLDLRRDEPRLTST